MKNLPLPKKEDMPLRKTALFLTLGLALTCAQATSNALGLSSSLNLLVFQDLNVPSSDVQGQVAVGGNASISSYSINTKSWGALYSGTGLTVAGNLTFSSGSTWADTVVGGKLITTGSASFHGNVSVGGDVVSPQDAWLSYGSLSYGGSASNLSQWQTPTAQKSSTAVNLGLDFAAEQARLSSLSLAYDGLANTGTVSDVYGNLVLDAGQLSLAVFDLQASDLLKNMTLSNVGANTTVLINVHGDSLNFSSHGYDGFLAGQVLFNLVDASTVTFSAGVTASFLAPQADFSTSYGVINGQVVAQSWSGSVQVNDAPFTGQISVSAVPEPQSYAMMVGGLALLGWVRRRQQLRTRA